MHSKVSVIIPAYNAEKTLESCVSSLLTQRYPIYEIIIVNDGSTDSTLAICKMLAIDHKVVVITQDNQGVSAARNKGLEMIHGEYVIFIDSDDVVDPDYVATLMSGKEFDFVTAGFYMQTRQKEWLIQQFTDESITTRQVQCNPSQYMGKYYFGAPFGKLFKTEIIEKYNLRFNQEIHSGEDTLFIFEYLSHTRNIRILPLSGYRYFYYEHSLAHKYHEDYWKWKLVVEKKIQAFFTPQNESEESYMYGRSFWVLQDLVQRYASAWSMDDIHRLIYKDAFFVSTIRRKMKYGSFEEKLFIQSMERKCYSAYVKYMDLAKFVQRCKRYIFRHLNK